MSVRSSLLAILTIGPAYGFQLHGELHARTAGRRSVNVGQIYSTLERLIDQGAVESAGRTPDGLPLYRLTGAGRAEALAWLHGTDSGPGAEWNDMLDRVLIGSSLAHIDLATLIDAYRGAWQRRLDRPVQAGQSGQAELNAAAEQAQATAALRWLDTVSMLAAGAGRRAGAFHLELSPVRPRRGRRPASAVGRAAADGRT